MVGRMDVPGRWAGGFRAWDENGVYLATGRGVHEGRLLSVPADAPARPGERVVPDGRPPHPGPLRHRPQHRVDRATTRVPGHAGHAGRRARARAQQPCRGRHPLRRRLDGACRVAAGVARPTGRAGHLRQPVPARSTSCAARSARRGGSGSAGPGGPRGRARRLGWPTTAWTTAGSSPPTFAPPASTVAWCERAAALLDARPSEPGLEWVAGTLSHVDAARRGAEATADLRAGRRGALVLADGPGLDAAGRRHRGAGEHAGDARAQAPRRRRRSCATTPPTSPASRRTPASSTRSGPTSSTTPSTRWAAGHAAGHDRADDDAVVGRGRRHRQRDGARRRRPRVRRVLHDQGRRQGHRPRARHRPPDRGRAPRRHHRHRRSTARRCCGSGCPGDDRSRHVTPVVDAFARRRSRWRHADRSRRQSFFPAFDGTTTTVKAVVDRSSTPATTSS